MSAFTQVAKREQMFQLVSLHTHLFFQRLSELLYLPMPTLPTSTQKSDSIQIGSNQGSLLSESEDSLVPGSKWVDEEERKFYEDIPDLRDFVPAGLLGVDEGPAQTEEGRKEEERQREEREKEEVRQLEEELKNLEVNGVDTARNEPAGETDDDDK